MMFVKICGITNREDLQAAVDAGADAVGFVFEPFSPRHIGDQPEWWKWVSDAPMNVRSVLVTATPETAPTDYIECFDALQCYVPEVTDQQSWLSKLPSSHALWLAFRIAPDTDPEIVLRQMEDWSQYTERFLLDTHDPSRLGGTGRTMNWELAHRICSSAPRPVLLAGGLTPENVVEAMREVQPYGVDVSTGVEAFPGKKDQAKLNAFIQRARLKS